MKCPKCGFTPIRGRPKKLDDQVVLILRGKGLSLRKIARELKVTEGAIRGSLKRTKAA